MAQTAIQAQQGTDFSSEREERRRARALRQEKSKGSSGGGLLASQRGNYDPFPEADTSASQLVDDPRFSGPDTSGRPHDTTGASSQSGDGDFSKPQAVSVSGPEAADKQYARVLRMQQLQARIQSRLATKASGASEAIQALKKAEEVGKNVRNVLTIVATGTALTGVGIIISLIILNGRLVITAFGSPLAKQFVGLSRWMALGVVAIDFLLALILGIVFFLAWALMHPVDAACLLSRYLDNPPWFIDVFRIYGQITLQCS